MKGIGLYYPAKIMKIYISSVLLLFLLCCQVNVSAQNAKCSKVSKAFQLLTDNFSKGIRVYQARHVRVCCPDSQGIPKYKFWGQDRNILFIVKVTGIECYESNSGTFIISVEVLDKWRNWVAVNCRKS